MSRLPIIDAISNYNQHEFKYFAMPGHKMGSMFLRDEAGRQFIEHLAEYDITEVDGMDNLHEPSGIIMEAQENLSKFYKSRKSYFLVNGSTSGNMIMIFSAFNENDKIIVERACHKSVFNSIVLRKLKPIYVESEISSDYDFNIGISTSDIIKKIRENPDAKGILITYPNYYGICTDIRDIVKEAKKYGMKVLIDGAHGAHFEASDLLPESVIRMGCDMAVFSAHKTLPSFTQTSYLHVNDEELIERAEYYISVFSSTSPSYMFMASLDYARYYLEKYGEEDYKELINLCDKYRFKINELGFYSIIEDIDIAGEDNYNGETLVDRSRYVISVPRGYSGHKLAEYLHENRIQCEMSGSREVVLIFSPSNTHKDFEMLYNILKECKHDSLRVKYTVPIKYDIPEAVLKPWEAVEGPKEKVAYTEAVGRICGQAITPYPPGIPLIMPGEIITEDIIRIIAYYIDNGISILGAKDKTITVLR